MSTIDEIEREIAKVKLLNDMSDGMTAPRSTRVLELAAIELTAANERIRALEASLIKAKGIPMKYKRMEFNAQLQDENSSLRTALTAERAISDKLEKALKVAKAFCDGLTAEECPDTIALPISAALAEVAALRKKENA